MTQDVPVCDYEGSDYRTRFWENQGRDYEDQAERVALRRLMPPTGRTLLEVGAGFGRLAQEYVGYERVVLFDYSRSLLREAQEMWGDDPRFIYVAGDWYKMPFVTGLFDTLVQIRTIHHAADVPALFQQLVRIMQPGGTYVLEFANKRNLKAMARYALRRQEWSPFTPEPVEFVALNFDFSWDWMKLALITAGFSPQGTPLTVSHFRVPLLKKVVPTGLLVGLDGMLQGTGRWGQWSPSVFVRSRAPLVGVNTAVSTPPNSNFFACPHDQTPLPHDWHNPQNLICPTCGREWGYDAGLYDFKAPVGQTKEEA
jgi:SAM-dependent methyltransferase